MIRKIQFFLLALVTLSLTSCLDITEEVTYRDNGSGSYTMKMDMSQLKGMLDMFKNMGDQGGAEAPDREGVVSDMEPAVEGDKKPATEEEENEHVPGGAEEMGAGMPGVGDLGKMGEEFSKSIDNVKKVKGVKNAVSINDTTNLVFGYTFDFDNVEALNGAINAMNKDKFEGKPGNTFVASKKSFERTKANDLGALIAQAMSESDEGAEGMDMIKMFFGDMKYKQIYRFDRKVKKSANSIAEISADGKTVTLVSKPFGDSENGKTVANVLKLK